MAKRKEEKEKESEWISCATSQETVERAIEPWERKKEYNS